MKEYTIKIGEIFTEKKAKELKEFLELKEKDFFQQLKSLKEDIHDWFWTEFDYSCMGQEWKDVEQIFNKYIK